MTEYSERQEAELDALRAMYPEDGAVSFDTIAVDSHQGSATACISEALSSHSGSVKLPGVQLHRRSVGIHFQLPTVYPEQAPEVHVICEAGEANCLALSSGLDHTQSIHGFQGLHTTDLLNALH